MGCPPYTPLSESWLSDLGTGLWILGSDIKKHPLCEKTHTGHNLWDTPPRLVSQPFIRMGMSDMVCKGGGTARPQEEPSRTRDGGGEHGCKPSEGFGAVL